MCEDRQLLNEDLGRGANSFFGGDRTIGLDLYHQLIEVGTLLHAGTLDGVADTLDRGERSVENNATNRLGRLVAVAAHITGHIATAFFHLDLHVQLGTL
ncbi:hypothetical protein SDC9_198525 [bioreactor metagenome]|uniref:Uncharacterized protein n=1 Tax=bioreactor metagenome TaxID=1076179 RepID=A0A645IHX8_9ZZZZ